VRLDVRQCDRERALNALDIVTRFGVVESGRCLFRLPGVAVNVIDRFVFELFADDLRRVDGKAVLVKAFAREKGSAAASVVVSKAVMVVLSQGVFAFLPVTPGDSASDGRYGK
jgi:hypothetical protein